MAAAAVPIPFALVPGDVNPNDVIDYQDESNRKYYLNMTKELKNNFNLTELNLKSFLSEIDQRSTEAGWHPLFNIPEDVNVNNGPTIHLLTHYGQVTLEQVRAYAQTFIGMPTRAAQLDMQVAMCVLKSLTKEAKDNIELESDKYTIGGTKVGILIIKVAQIKARADTQFTADAIRSKLRNLSQAMTDNSHNIDKFNQHVRALISSLAARGLTPGDSLYTDLMAGYVTCTDQAFVKYIQTKQDQHDERAGGQDMAEAAEEIMTFASQKYIQLLERNLWKPTQQGQQDDDIIALKAEMERLKSGKSKKEWVPPAWKTVAPTNGQPKVKVSKGKTYHWCPNHLAWTIHKPEECNKIPSGGSTTQEEVSRGESGNSSPKLRLSEALSAVMQE
jgi:hypothetical protein